MEVAGRKALMERKCMSIFTRTSDIGELPLPPGTASTGLAAMQQWVVVQPGRHSP